MRRRDGVELGGGIRVVSARDVPNPAPKHFDTDADVASVSLPATDLEEATQTLAIVNSHTLMREALTILLEMAGPFRVIAAETAHDLLKQDKSLLADVQVIVFHVASVPNCERDPMQDIAVLRRELPNTPLFLVSDSEDAGEVREALRQGIKGYAPTTLTSQVLVSAIKLVKLGGTFVPVGPLTEKGATSSGVLSEDEDDGDASENALTVRQKQVLDLLRQGKPNKVIARELELQESTVKIHVREIMRKLHVPNRTAAALYAIGNSQLDYRKRR